MTTCWTTLSGTTIGSVHVRDHLPIQDSVLTWSDPESGQAVIAVADGHGHKLHFRSDTGSALAAVSAVEELRRMLPHLGALDGPDNGEAALDLLNRTAASLVDTWVAKVEHHLEANPYSPAEEEIGAAGDPLRAYGTTILAAAAIGDLIAFLQIGDGDSVLVSSHGEASRPLPEDPDLDGLHTSSLCQPRPLDALRVAVVDARVDDVALVYLCTDGFGRPRVDADGPGAARARRGRAARVARRAGTDRRRRHHDGAAGALRRRWHRAAGPRRHPSGARGRGRRLTAG
jgi:hypothetical protein